MAMMSDRVLLNLTDNGGKNTYVSNREILNKIDVILERKNV